MVPVVYEIHFLRNENFIKMGCIDSDYPDENEILLQDGLTYSITGKNLVHLA